MQLSFSLDSANRDRWHEGSDRVDGPDARASSLLLVPGARLGLRAGLEARMALPVAWMWAEDPMEEVSDFGFGDLLTEVRWNRVRAGWNASVSAGSYWPLGDLNSDGLPATATFSTGTVDPTFGLRLAGPPLGDLGWSLASSVRWVIGEQEDGRRLGSSFTNTLALDRKVTADFATQLQLVHFHRQSDDGPAMEPSGGDWLYLVPVVSYRIFAEKTHGLQTTLSVRLPLVQDVRGRQLVESPALSFGLGYTREL